MRAPSAFRLSAFSLSLMLAITGACQAQSAGQQQEQQQQSAADRFDQFIRGDSAPAVTTPRPRAAQQPSATPGGRRPPAAASSGNQYLMRWAKLVDQSGFAHPMEAGSVLVPADWKFDGRVQWGPPTGCTQNLMTTSGRATSPDGLSGFEWFPTYTWVWMDDPQTRGIMQQAASQQPESARPCAIDQIASPVDFIRHAIIPRMRPTARIISAQMLPELTRTAQARIEADNAQYLRMGLFTGVRSQVGEVKITYEINGQPVEESLMAQIDVVVQQAPSAAGLSQGMMTASNTYTVLAERLFAIRAPAGQLAPRADLYSTMLVSLRQNSQWLDAAQQILSNISGAQQQGTIDRQRIVHDAQTAQGDAIIQHGEEVSVMEDRSAAEFSQAQRDVEWYTDPSTNERMELSAGYGHSWTNSNGTVILNDDPNFNPSRVYQGNWTRLERNQ
jgi:hypothetical protein